MWPCIGELLKGDVGWSHPKLPPSVAAEPVPVLVTFCCPCVLDVMMTGFVFLLSECCMFWG